MQKTSEKGLVGGEAMIYYGSYYVDSTKKQRSGENVKPLKLNPM